MIDLKESQRKFLTYLLWEKKEKLCDSNLQVVTNVLDWNGYNKGSVAQIVLNNLRTEYLQDYKRSVKGI